MFDFAAVTIGIFGFIFYLFLLIGILMKKTLWILNCLFCTAVILVISFIFHIYQFRAPDNGFLYNPENGVRGILINCRWKSQRLIMVCLNLLLFAYSTSIASLVLRIGILSPVETGKGSGQKSFICYKCGQIVKTIECYCGQSEFKSKEILWTNIPINIEIKKIIMVLLTSTTAQEFSNELEHSNNQNNKNEWINKSK